MSKTNRDKISAPSGINNLFLQRFSRVTTPGRKFLPQIDGLRFVAISAVLAYHISLSFAFYRGHADLVHAPDFFVNTIFSCGHNGVPLFFAISGFILSLPFARCAIVGGPPIKLREYYFRRLTRIEPPYIIQLLVMLLLCIFVLHNLPTRPQLFHNRYWLAYSLSHIGASLAYCNGFIFGDHPFPNYVLWSLEVEVQFYLLAPFLAGNYFSHNPKGRRFALLGVIAGGMAVVYFFGRFYRVWASLLGNLHFFLIGILFADLFVSENLVRTPGSYLWDIAVILGVALMVYGGPAASICTVPMAVVLSFLAAFRGIVIAKFLQIPWIVIIGGMCYTIYLYHVVLLSALTKFSARIQLSSPSADLLLQFTLLAPVVFLISAVLFVILERPFMDRNWPVKLLHFFQPHGSSSVTSQADPSQSTSQSR